MIHLIRAFNKCKPLFNILLVLLFIVISINTALKANNLFMKGFIILIAILVTLFYLYYEYLKKLYFELQKRLIQAQSLQAVYQQRQQLINKDFMKGMTNSILLSDVLLSLDENKPEKTIQLIHDNEKFFGSSLDMLLIKKHSLFKAYTLLNNRSQAKEAYDELSKLKETNLDKRKKMSLLYNWKQIEALHLSFVQHKHRQALSLFQSIDSSKMNPREQLHLAKEMRDCALACNNTTLVKRCTQQIQAISQDSPFREVSYEK